MFMAHDPLQATHLTIKLPLEIKVCNTKIFCKCLKRSMPMFVTKLYIVMVLFSKSMFGTYLGCLDMSIMP